MTAPDHHPATHVQRRAAALKERVYVTFTTLAVTLALQTHADETSPGAAAMTLSIAVIGTLLAVFVADFLSHLTIHSAVPSLAEFRHMLAVTGSGATVLVAPLLLLAAAGLGLWSVASALSWVLVVLIATLALVGYLAIRNLALPFYQRAIILFAEVILGIVVIGLEVLAHG